MKNQFTGQTVPMKKSMTELWRQSTQVAALSMVLSKQLKIVISKRARLAGLIHNVGAMAILAYSGRFLESDPELSNLQFILDKLRGQVGVIVINQWGLGADFVEVVLEADNPGRDHLGAIDYADIVITAKLILDASKGSRDSKHPLQQAKIWSMTPEAEEAGFGLEILNQARCEIDELMQ